MELNAKKIIKYVLLFLAAIALVYFAFRKVEWSTFVEGLKITRWGYVALSGVAAVLALVFRALRWHGMLLPLDKEIKLIDVWDADNIGAFANIALPGSGELIRCGAVTTRQASYDKVLGTVVMERIWDIIAIILLIVAAVGLNWDVVGGFFVDNILSSASGRLPVLWMFVGAFVLIGIYAWICWAFRSKNKFFEAQASILKGLWTGLMTFFKMDHKLLFGVYTIMIWVMYILMCWFCVLAMPALDGFTVLNTLFISAIGNMASVIPVPGGIGAYHYLIALCFTSVYSFSWETGILLATLAHESHTLVLMILGLISYASKSVRSGKRS